MSLEFHPNNLGKRRDGVFIHMKYHIRHKHKHMHSNAHIHSNAHPCPQIYIYLYEYENGYKYALFAT